MTTNGTYYNAEDLKLLFCFTDFILSFHFTSNSKRFPGSPFLPSELVEVSGNTWIDKDHLILIEDLHPNLYYVNFDNGKATLQKTIPFAETDKDKVDIEDRARVRK